jgi:hypothetical protein
MNYLDLASHSDAELLVGAFDEDQPPYVMGDEIDRRFGEGANDRLASYFTASHASGEDMTQMACDDTDLLVEIAKGEHVHTTPTCRCGARQPQ